MIKETAYAKINIGLDIVNKRSDGFHNIDTIMQSVLLCDEVYLEKAPGISIACSDPVIPTDESNTVYKAASVFFIEANIDYNNTGVLINLKKNIPSQAGLGGGSSDAAAVLRGLNNLYCTNFGTSVLRELALKIGSDVPYCIEGGTQRAKGQGEKLTRLPDFNDINIIIIMPGETVDTAYAYSQFEKSDFPVHCNMQTIENAIVENNLQRLSNSIKNTFESLIFPVKPAIEKAKHDILESGAILASMTGSGAAVFGIYKNRNAAEDAYLRLKERHQTYLTKTIGGVT